jgi:hypothetical protein
MVRLPSCSLNLVLWKLQEVWVPSPFDPFWLILFLFGPFWILIQSGPAIRPIFFPLPLSPLPSFLSFPLLCYLSLFFLQKSCKKSSQQFHQKMKLCIPLYLPHSLFPVHSKHHRLRRNTCVSASQCSVQKCAKRPSGLNFD